MSDMFFWGLNPSLLREMKMRSIYLGKANPKCPSCGGPKASKPVGWTVGGTPVYSCKDGFHERVK